MPDVTPTSPSLLPTLTFRRIDPVRDAKLAVAHHLDACVASFGTDARYQGDASYLRWLRARVEEYPDGHVLVYRRCDGACVGQLELQVPYGFTAGYVNLFYVTESLRRQGYGAALHEYAERYFRSWEASRIDLHVSPANEAAVGFYRRMGYKLARVDPRRPGSMWLMSKALSCAVAN
jgi:ribosomal protein S18 acetylase RimI-like enzyme